MAWIERAMSPSPQGFPGGPRPALMAERVVPPAGREQTINVLVLEAQYRSFVGQPVVEAKPQLAGQGSEAAAL